MEIYDCKVLLGGSRDNEVRKKALSAAEIVILRHIHGHDAVLEINHVGSSPIPDSPVREMLAFTYGGGNFVDAQHVPHIMREVFGPPSMALPQTIEGVPSLQKRKEISAKEVTRWRGDREADLVEAAREASPSFAD